MTSKRSSRNIAGLKQVQMTGTTSHHGNNVFSSLRAAQLLTSKPVLPAELMVRILDYLAIVDLTACARVSRQFREMVYEDARWVQKLQAMAAWKEGDARQNFENAMRRKVEAQQQKGGRHNEGLEVLGSHTVQSERQQTSSTLFDVGVEEERVRRLTIRDDHRMAMPHRPTDGFDETPSSPVVPRTLEFRAALTVLDHVKSVRGRARQEFGKVYAVLGPLYIDLVKAQSQADAIVFRALHTPEDQAQILSALTRFARHDSAIGAEERQAKLTSMIKVFEHAVIQEFHHAIEAKDVDGRMKRYAHVLYALNGGQSGVAVFLSTQSQEQRNLRFGSPLDCLENVAPGHVDLNASQRFFEQLIRVSLQAAEVIERTFPDTIDVYTPFLRRLCVQYLSDYVRTLADEAHAIGKETYVKAVSGCFGQAMQFVAALHAVPASPSDFTTVVTALVAACFEQHIDLYLAEELSLFRSRSQAEIDEFDKQTSEQQATAESYFMSNVSRQAAKRDFLSSFRKVVMMPVNAFPSPFASSSKSVVNKNTADLTGVDTAYVRTSSPSLGLSTASGRASTPRPEAPTTELAAKTAIMNSRLEGIKSLFSIDVALNLTHFAKASLERAAIIAKMPGQFGEDGKQQCELVFVELLHILGTRHVREGFDKAVMHLSTYDPRQVREYRAKFSTEPEEGGRVTGVEPLMTFLELVNVGDLIQQMVDVFYNEELLSKRLTERDDFLSPAVKEKKRFEQMLDERVAAGLSKGIDVLMDEVEFLCATTQAATDFNPVADIKAGHSAALDIDIGPSSTARQVIDIVSSHTSMLVGSTDKTMLDVFMQEVGLRLFGVLCKHIKRQRISVDGAIKLISDVNHYAAYITSLRQKPILPYFSALRELGQIYLVYIDPPVGVFGSGTGKDAKRGSLLSMKATKTQLQAKELATIIADNQRYYGIFPAEEVYEFAERRADWYLVKNDVERAMYGAGCSIM